VEDEIVRLERLKRLLSADRIEDLRADLPETVPGTDIEISESPTPSLTEDDVDEEIESLNRLKKTLKKNPAAKKVSTKRKKRATNR
jgi:hypothetical protein